MRLLYLCLLIFFFRFFTTLPIIHPNMLKYFLSVISENPTSLPVFPWNGALYTIAAPMSTEDLTCYEKIPES